MRAVVYTRFGPPEVLRVADVPKPVPGADEALIQVRAAALNPLDWRMMQGLPWAARVVFRIPKPTATRPGRPGRDVAGRVESVGGNVTRFKPGDEVFGWCTGALAEFACTSESALVLKPANVTFEQAASVPVAALTALQGLRDRGRVRVGHKVLINGAAGGVGTFAVQIAKALGAHVTGVCSPANVEMVRTIGADRVVDYTREDFTTGETRFDVILDCVANHPLSAYRRALEPTGTCVTVGGKGGVASLLGRGVHALALSPFVAQRFVTFVARLVASDLAAVAELITAGKVAPVVDRRYGLSEAADALRYLEEGHARGKVVVLPD